jgi:hypothetical protein
LSLRSSISGEGRISYLFGLRAALFFTRAHARLYRPCVTQFSAKAPPVNSRLALQFQKLEDTIHTYIQEANLAV